MQMNELEFKRLRLEDLPDCIDLACRSFEHFKDDADAVRHWFDARISNNPWQHALDGIGLGAREGGRLVACRTMFAQPWWINGRSTVIAFAAHTSIEPAYRGHGVGGRLIAASRDFADLTGSTTAGDITQKAYRKQHFVAVGGEGNDFFRTRTSYVGSLQSRLGGPLGLAVGRLVDTLSGGAERRLGGARGFRLQPVSACGDEFDELWARARSGYASCLVRSRQYLNWRVFDFQSHPLELAALRDDSGRLRGYAIWHEESYSKYVSCAVLRDLFVARDDEESLAAAVVLLTAHWRRRGISWASIEVASDSLTPLFASLGYERVPSIGNRYHVYSKQVLNQHILDGWFRSGLDGDYFDTRPRQGHATLRHEP